MFTPYTLTRTIFDLCFCTALLRILFSFLSSFLFSLHFWRRWLRVLEAFQTRALSVSPRIHLTTRHQKLFEKPQLNKTGAEEILHWLRLKTIITQNPQSPTWEMNGQFISIICCSVRQNPAYPLYALRTMDLNGCRWDASMRKHLKIH